MNRQIGNMQIEPVATTADLMARYQVKRLTIYRWVVAGKFNGGRGYFQLDDGQYRFYQSAVESYEQAKLQRKRPAKVAIPPAAEVTPGKRQYHRKSAAEKAAEAARPKRKYTKRVS